MSASITVQSTRNRRLRKTLRSTAAFSVSRFNSATISGPNRRVSFNTVVECGTGSESPILQKRRQDTESATSLTKVS